MSGNHIIVTTSRSETASVGPTATNPVGPIRKRGRRDSDSNSKDIDQRPPFKMSRSEDTDTDNEMDGLMCSSSSSSSPTVAQAESVGRIQKQRIYHRDEKYYFEDGSCVLRVADVLFNVSLSLFSSSYLSHASHQVHRSSLSRDSSSFSTMFSLPQGNAEVEGRSDDNPIVLTGESPEEFRHFLWALYALFVKQIMTVYLLYSNSITGHQN